MSRGGVSFEGHYEPSDLITFQAAGSVSSVMLVSGAAYVEDMAVAVENNGVAGFGSAGDPLLGRIDKYDSDHYMTVQVAGTMTLPGVSGSLPLPNAHVVVNGDGKVSAATTVQRAIVLSSDATANVNTVTVLLG